MILLKPRARPADVVVGDPLLEIAGLTIHFGGVAALENVNLTVRAGSIHAMIGPNGAGKTTLFNCISRMYRPKSGSIRFGRVDLLALPATALAGLGIVRTFQNVGLFPNMTVNDNVLTGAHARMESSLLADALALPASRIQQRQVGAELEPILDKIGLGRQRHTLVTDLSYGQQKMVELARALAARPRLLLLDEPSAGLSRPETASLHRIVEWARHELAITVLLIGHDMHFVMGLSDHVTVLNYGVAIADGTAAEVQRHAAVREAYLGTEDIGA
jgi:ABC-type branched-subunit amino acid transport system ATPase component